jgi:hypothetical protein
MMVKVMPRLLVMALVLHRVLAMIDRIRERMSRLCKMLPKDVARNVMLMLRTKLTRCDEG